MPGLYDKLQQIDEQKAQREQARTQQAISNRQWESPQHRYEALKFADAKYGKEYDFKSYITGRPTVFTDPATGQKTTLKDPGADGTFWRVVAQYNDGLSRMRRNLKPIDYKSASYDPTKYNDDYNDQVGAYVRETGAHPSDMTKFNAWRVTNKYKDQYTNTIEDEQNQKQGLPPLSVQRAQSAAQEMESFKQRAQQLQGGDRQAYTDLLNSYPVLRGYQAYADKQAYDDQQRQAKAAEDGTPLYDYGDLFGTKKSDALPYDEKALSAIGYDKLRGFNGIIDDLYSASVGQRSADNAAQITQGWKDFAAQQTAGQQPAPQQQTEPVQQPQQKSLYQKIDEALVPVSQVTGRILNAPQALYLNALNALTDLMAGRTPQYNPDMSGAQYAADAVAKTGASDAANIPAALQRIYTNPQTRAATAKALGLPEDSDAAEVVSNLQGAIAQMPYEAATDPTTALGAGELAFLARGGKALKIGDAGYETALQAGKLTPKTGAGALNELNAMEAEQAAGVAQRSAAEAAPTGATTQAQFVAVKQALANELGAEPQNVRYFIEPKGSGSNPANRRLQPIVPGDAVPQGSRVVVTANKPNGATMSFDATDDFLQAKPLTPKPLMPAAYPNAGKAWGQMPKPKELPKPTAGPTTPKPRALGNTTDNATQAARSADNAATAGADDALGIMPAGFDETTGGLKKFGREMYRLNVSGVAPVERASKLQGKSAAVSLADRVQAIRDAGGRVDNILERGLSSKAGDTIGKSWKQINGDVSDLVGDMKKYNEYRQHLHNIARQAEGKPVLSATAEESQRYVADALANNPKYKQADKLINDFNDRFMREHMVGGLLSEDQYKAMRQMYPDYIPTLREEYRQLGRGGGSNAVGGGRVAASGVKRATGATSEIVPLEDAFATNVNKFVRASAKNDLYAELLDWAAKNPTDAAPYVRLSKADPAADVFKNGVNGAAIEDVVEFADKQSVREVKKGLYELTAYVNGKPVTGQISKEIYDSLNYLAGREIPDWLRKGMEVAQRFITNPFKTLTTGVNAEFWVRNTMRDVPTAYAYSIENNPLKYVKYHKDAIGQMATNGEKWKLYRALGGNRSGFYATEKGFIASNKPTLIGKIGKAANATGETLEAEPRFTEFLAALDKYGDTPAGRLKAMSAAADVTVNFGRKSPVSEVLNAFVPYYNAGVQGMDKFFRAFKSSPVKASAKLIPKALATMTTFDVALTALNQQNPYYRDLDNRNKDAYFVIPNLGNLDENGYAKTFIKIPKSRELGAVFGSAMSRVVRWVEGDKEPFKDFGETVLNNFLPPNPITDNVAATPYLNLKFNRDFAGRPIVPQSMQSLDPPLQYDATTSDVAKYIGKTFNMSPKQVDYVIAHYGGGVADFLQKSTTGSTADVGDAIYKTFIKPWQKQFTADPVYSSQVVLDFYNKLDEANRKALSRNAAEKIDPGANTPEERMRSAMQNAADEMADLKKQEKDILDGTDEQAVKDQKITALRQQAIEVARKAMTDFGAGPTNTRIYPAGVDDQKRAAYDKIVSAGVSEDKLQAVFARLKGIKPTGTAKAVTVGQRKAEIYKMVKEGKLTTSEYGTIIRNYYPN